MNLSRLLGSKRTNEYSRTDKARFQDLCKIHLNTEFDEKYRGRGQSASDNHIFVQLLHTKKQLGLSSMQLQILKPVFKRRY